DRRQVAGEAFLDAVTAPLRLRGPDGAPAYPWTFEPGGAERLAAAFSEERRLHPHAPLMPELQVVLDYLLERAEVIAAAAGALSVVCGLMLRDVVTQRVQQLEAATSHDAASEAYQRL